MEIKRNRYLNTLISKKHNGLIKVITGMRRCGKSYLLFTLFKEHLLSDGIDENHIIEIAFDAFENKKYRDPDVLYPYLKKQIKDDAMYYILLDEVVQCKPPAKYPQFRNHRFQIFAMQYAQQVLNASVSLAHEHIHFLLALDILTDPSHALGVE